MSRGDILALLLILSSVSSPLAAAQSGGSQATSPDGIVPQGTRVENPGMQKVPSGVILVPGAVPSASDTVTPVPEGGVVADSAYSSLYFGLSYPIPSGFAEKYKGPPPSDRGFYVLTFLRPFDAVKTPNRASILITAQDMFFTLVPAANALELINYTKNNLQADYKVELPLTVVNIAGHSFSFFAYESPVAKLHWYILATQIRCHAVEIVLTSRDTKLLDNLMQDMDKLKLPGEASPIAGTGGGAVPVCIKDYARDENVIERVDPIFTERKFNQVPVRIIIDKEGRVKHIHFISAFPDQAKAITDALGQWRFRPFLWDGQPVEVETGIMFGRALPSRTPLASDAVNE
jgi:hypothetical protein